MRIKNKSGIVLVTVILVSVVMSVVAVGVMSTHVSQVKSGDKVSDTVRVEELAKGVLYQYQQRKLTGGGNVPSTIDIDGKTYTVFVQERGNVGTPGGAEDIRVYINEPCEPACAGKQCGPDGCGATCPPGCIPPLFCNVATFQCDCVVDCTGKNCGDDGCGGSCGSCVAPDTCDGSGQCVCGPDCSCAATTCVGNTCADGCGGNCNGTKTDGACCTPDCTCAASTCVGNTCSDGCGGNCNGTKTDGACCTPDCSCAATTCVGNTCSDGCGGTCNGTKTDGACCTPDCTCAASTCVGNTCADGCGGTCNGTKSDGACCTPDCTCAASTCVGNTCADGCGGTCNGTQAPLTCGDLGYECGPGDDGCGATLDCGTCPVGDNCSSGACLASGGSCVEATTFASSFHVSIRDICMEFCCGTPDQVSLHEGCDFPSNCSCAATTCVGDYCIDPGNSMISGGGPVAQCCGAKAPETCATLGVECGNWDDGCGTILDCGTCPSGESCDAGVCVAACAEVTAFFATYHPSVSDTCMQFCCGTPDQVTIHDGCENSPCSCASSTCVGDTCLDANNPMYEDAPNGTGVCCGTKTDGGC